MINNYEHKTSFFFFFTGVIMFKLYASSFSLMPAKAEMED